MHRLLLPGQIAACWLEVNDPKSKAVALLNGTVFTDLPTRAWLGCLDCQVVHVRGFPSQIELGFDVTDDQLVSLDRAQLRDEDIRLEVTLQITLLYPPTGIESVVSQQIHHRITRARWLHLLDELGSEVGIVLRVPSPLTDATFASDDIADKAIAASLSQATARLRQAREELRDHRWEDCVATCRKVLENLDHLTKPQKPRDLPSDLKARTQAQRWAAIYHAVTNLTHGAHHDDDTTVQFVWSRADAEPILATTASLLAHYAREA